MKFTVFLLMAVMIIGLLCFSRRFIGLVFLRFIRFIKRISIMYLRNFEDNIPFLFYLVVLLFIIEIIITLIKGINVLPTIVGYFRNQFYLLFGINLVGYLYRSILKPYLVIAPSRVLYPIFIMIPYLMLLSIQIEEWSLFESIIVLVFVSILYIYNVVCLINMIKLTKAKKLSISDIWKNIIIIIIIFIIVLSFLVYMSTFITHDTFSTTRNSLPTYFDILYFTIVTFLSIGCDLYPIHAVSKCFAILIGFTSILCLSIFINAVISAKPANEGRKHNSNDQNQDYVFSWSIVKLIKVCIKKYGKKKEAKIISRICINVFLSPIDKLKKIKAIPKEKYETEFLYMKVEKLITRYRTQS